jgi:hypothetical protein
VLSGAVGGHRDAGPRASAARDDSDGANWQLGRIMFSVNIVMIGVYSRRPVSSNKVLIYFQGKKNWKKQNFTMVFVAGALC